MTIIAVMDEAKWFRVVYHSQLKSHLSAIDRKYHSLISQTIDTQIGDKKGNRLWIGGEEVVL